MERYDGKKIYRQLYAPPRRPVIVDVPELAFVMVDGSGAAEGSEAFRGAIGALYSV